jgi:hypothetical protein
MNQPFDMRSSAQEQQPNPPEKRFDTHGPVGLARGASNRPRRFNQFFSTRVLVGMLVLLLVGASAGMLYFYRQAVTPEEGSAAQVSHAVAVVGRLMVLPEGETPTVATVSDPQKLQDQPFFAKAEKGDLVLIYPLAHRAILYSPKLNKIIEVAPINLANQAPAATTPPPGK